MTKDPIIFGACAGFAGNLPKLILAWVFHFTGHLRYTFEQIAAGLFVSAKYLDDPISIVIGVIADWTMAGFLGILILYFIRNTGDDYAIFKAILFSLAEFIFVYGALMAMDVTSVALTFTSPLPNFLLLFPHLVFGITAGYFIRRYNMEHIA